MTNDSSDSLVSVFSTPVAYEAELVKAMLIDEGIHSSVEDTNGPFPGISATPCHVYVTAEHEPRARVLISEYQTQHKERVDREFEEEMEAADEENLEA